MDFVQQREMVVRYQAGDRRAGDLLLLQVEKFIRLVAKRYVRPWEPDFEDVLQAGREGFLKGCRRFDGREIHLLTYANHWIKNNITRFLKNEGAVVRFPVHQYDDYTNRAGVVQRKRRSLRHRTVFTFSEMAASQRESEHYAFEDTLIDGVPLAEETLTDAELEYWIPQVAAHWMAHLEPRERDVLLRRFQEPEETLESIAQSYNLTRERIRQVEAIALRKMRHKLGLHTIKPKASKLSFKQWVGGLVTIMLTEKDMTARAEEIAAAKTLADKRTIQLAQAIQRAGRAERLKPPPPVQPQWPTATPLRRWRAPR